MKQDDHIEELLGNQLDFTEIGMQQIEINNILLEKSKVNAEVDNNQTEVMESISRNLGTNDKMTLSHIDMIDELFARVDKLESLNSSTENCGNNLVVVLWYNDWEAPRVSLPFKTWLAVEKYQESVRHLKKEGTLFWHLRPNCNNDYLKDIKK